MDIKNILKELTSTVGVSGKETDAVLTAQRLLSEFGKTREDVLHSAICEIEGDRAGHILLDAHIDRIGLIVTSVTDEGFLHVAACGGVDRRTLNGQEVTVYGREPVFGVIASTPPHLASGDNERKATEIDDILIDIGAKISSRRKSSSPRETERLSIPLSSRSAATACPAGHLTTVRELPCFFARLSLLRVSRTKSYRCVFLSRGDERRRSKSRGI